MYWLGCLCLAKPSATMNLHSVDLPICRGPRRILTVPGTKSKVSAKCL